MLFILKQALCFYLYIFNFVMEAIKCYLILMYKRKKDIFWTYDPLTKSHFFSIIFSIKSLLFVLFRHFWSSGRRKQQSPWWTITQQWPLKCEMFLCVSSTPTTKSSKRTVHSIRLTNQSQCFTVSIHNIFTIRLPHAIGQNCMQDHACLVLKK